MSSRDQRFSSDNLADFIWQNADLLWGDFKHVDFGKVILPFTLLRRLECVLAPTREEVAAAHERAQKAGQNLDIVLPPITGRKFYNTSTFTLGTLGSTKTRDNLESYIAGFSANARQIFSQFKFAHMVEQLDDQGILYQLARNFAAIDLSPETVPDWRMSEVYEHLIGRFGAEINEQAEDFMTPRDVVHLATDLVFHGDEAYLQRGAVRRLYDPTCGTGGFLSDAISRVRAMAPNEPGADVRLVPYGQELEPETHAVALTNMLIQNHDPRNIALGSTLADDRHGDKRFHYILANPPFGKKWEKDKRAVELEHREFGFAGRFGAGLPNVGDGSMLFLQHVVNKLERPENFGGRAAIVLSGSPLFNGKAGSGESNIRRWLFENDYVDAIVALPTDLFFRTGIGTYLWILSNKKPEHRRGKVQLINAVEMHQPMRKSIGNKRREIADAQRSEIAQVYQAFETTAVSKIFDASDFGYRRITVERPLRLRFEATAEALAAYRSAKAAQHADAFAQVQGSHTSLQAFLRAAGVSRLTKGAHKAVRDAFGTVDPEAEPTVGSDGKVLPDPALRDHEIVPLGQDVSEFFEEEVKPYVADAWIDQSKRDPQDSEFGVVGYEVNFNRYFYEYNPPRPLSEIDEELKDVEKEIFDLLKDVADV